MDNATATEAFFNSNAEEITEAARHRLVAYAGELVKWNRSINLVGRAPLADLLERHFLDSLALAPLLDPAADTLLDIGTGAGFPGLALKAALPDLAVTLVEPRQKRQAFLKHIIRTLGLTGVTVVGLHLRADDPEQQRAIGPHSVVTSRALSDITAFLALAAPFCMEGGRALCMKGPAAGDEIRRWQTESAGSPFHLEDHLHYTLPVCGVARTVVIFRKQP